MRIDPVFRLIVHQILAHVLHNIAVSILAEIIQVKHGFSVQVPETQTVEEMTSFQAATDPVCGMTVDVGESSCQSEYNGALFYFCCAGCKQAFDRQPERHVGLISEDPSHV